MANARTALEIESRYNGKGAKAAKKDIKSLSQYTKLAKNEMKTMVALVTTTIGAIHKLTSETDRLVTTTKLLSTTFGENTTEIKDYATNLANITGLSEAGIYKQNVLFGQVANSLGIANENAIKYTKSLTNLSAKLAMVYNIDFESAAKSLVDAAKGESSTLTTLTGIVIKQNSLQNTLYSIGINKQVSDLNSAEQAMLQYIAVARQMTSANDAVASSVNSVAWQKQMLGQQVKRLATAFGQLLYPILEKILPILNGILMVITNIISVLARLVGYNGKVSETVNSGANSWGNYGSKIEEAANKAKKSLRSFDKLNNITTPSSSGSGIGGGLGIDPKLQGEFDALQTKLDNIKNRATEISESIMKWLGFTKNANGEWEFSHITLGTILATTGLILGAGWKIYKVIKTINGIKGLLGTKTAAKTAASSVSGKLGFSFAQLSLIAGSAIAQTMNLGAQFQKTTERISKGETLIEASKPTGFLDLISKLIAYSTLLSTYGVSGMVAYALGATKVGKELSKTNKISKETNEKIKTINDNLIQFEKDMEKIDINKSLLINNETKDKIISNMNELTTKIKNQNEKTIKEEIKTINDLVKKGYMSESEAKIAKANVKKYYNELDKELSVGEKQITNILQNAANENRALTDKERQDINKIYEEMTNSTIKTLSSNAEEQKAMLNALKSTKTQISKETASEMIKDAIKTRDETIKAAKEQYTETVNQANRLYGAGAISEEVYNKMISGAEKTKNDTIAKAKEQSDGIYKELKSSQKNIAEYIDKDTGDILGAWGRLWQKVTNWFKNWKEKNKKLFNLDFNFSASTKNSGGGSGGAKGFADGGFPTTGQMFIAREAGPELVGTMKGKTTVANNDQIVKGIEQASFQGMMKAMTATGGYNTKVEISAEGDASGLLNFINFSQKQKNRQFDL